MKVNYNTLRIGSVVALIVMIVTGFALTGKKDANSPGFEFFPDMYRSPSVEVYGESVLDGDTIWSTRADKFLPVKRTIARGYLPYPYPNNDEGYNQAGLYLKNPLPFSEQTVKEGEELYGKYCLHCHGATGGGDGKVGLKLPGAPPAYNGGALKNLPEGKIFHSITYGKGLMGNHATMLTQEERWKLTYFVQKLQGPKTAPADSTLKAAAPGAGKETKPEEKKG